MEELRAALSESSRFLSDKIKNKPRIGIILGTGLGELADRISIAREFPYEEIPGFPHSTVPGHAGRLLAGTSGGKDLLVMQGRTHFYEGYHLEKVTFPVRVMRRVGIETLIVSNAAGALNPNFAAGDVMVITDHINLTGQNPLIGPNLDDFGPRFPDMTRVYDPVLVRLAAEAALEEKIGLHKGVYVGVTGPSMETPAETRFLRMTGADAVGMSTIPEVIVAAHCGLRVLAFSAISNVNLPDCMKPAPIEEVLANAAVAGRKMIRIIEALLKRIQ